MLNMGRLAAGHGDWTWRQVSYRQAWALAFEVRSVGEGYALRIVEYITWR